MDNYMADLKLRIAQLEENLEELKDELLAQEAFEQGGEIIDTKEKADEVRDQQRDCYRKEIKESLLQIATYINNRPPHALIIGVASTNAEGVVAVDVEAIGSAMDLSMISGVIEVEVHRKITDSFSEESFTTPSVTEYD